MESTINNCSGKKSKANKNDETHEPNKKIRKLNTNSLVTAIKKQDIKKVRQFLTEQKDDYIPEGITVTPLHHAAESGNIEIVKLLFDHGYGTVNIVNKQKKTPLQLAIKKNHLDVIKYLFENGAKNALSQDELHELIYSHVKSNKAEILKILVKGENISDFLINCAVQRNYLESLKSLLEFGNVTNKNISYYDFLHTAAKNGNLDILKLLFNNGYDIAAKNSQQQTPLLWAVIKCREKVVEFLVKNGAKDKLSFKDLNEILRKSIAKNCLYILKRLNSSDTISASVLNFAAANGHLEILKFLLECGVKIKSTPETVLQCAARRGQLDVVKYLIEIQHTNTKLMNCSNADLGTPLHSAARFGRFEIVQYFIENGHFVNDPKTFHGFNPIELAVTGGYLKIVKYFLEKHVEGVINYKKEIFEKNYSLLHYAASYGKLDILKLLIEYGADINKKAEDETPLHKGIRSGHVDIVRELLKLGAEEFAVPKDISSEKVSDKILALLLFAGHSLEAYFKGEKPILVAAKLGYTELVKALLSTGVDVNANESPDKTPLNLAVIARKSEMVNVLLNAGAYLESTIVSRLIPLKSCMRDIYPTKHITTQTEILRKLLDHVPKNELQQIVVKCINSAIKNKMAITTIETLLEYDFNNHCKLSIHCLDSEIIVFHTLLYHIEKVETLIKFQSLILDQFCRYFDRNFLKALTSRILFLMSLSGNFVIDEQTHLNFVVECQLRKWCKKCEMEIYRMQRTKILPGELDVTYYDLLAKHIHKAVNYVRNEKLITNLNYNDFVIYKEFFEKRISRAKNRSLYIDQSQKSLYNIILNGLQIHVPIEIVDKICEYLPVMQLDRLQQAFP